MGSWYFKDFLYAIVFQLTNKPQFGKFCDLRHCNQVPNQIQFVQLSNNRKSYTYIYRGTRLTDGTILLMDER